MRRVLLLLLLPAVIACKKPEQAAPQAGSGSGAPPAKLAAVPDAGPPAAAGSGAAPAAPAAAGAAELAFDSDPDEMEVGMAAAFDKRVPRLPAINGDGTLIANFDSSANGPSVPLPMLLAIRKLGAAPPVETLPIVDDQMVIDAAKLDSHSWPPAAVGKQLHVRAQAVLARLRGFHSLARIELATASGGEPQPTKIGDFVLAPEPTTDDRLVVALRDAHGRLIHREEIRPYERGTRNVGTDQPVPCAYRPVLGGVYRDPARPSQLYVHVGYRYSDECDPADATFLPFTAAPPDPAGAPDALITQQFDLVGVNELDRASVLAPDAMFVGANLVTDQLKLLGVATRAMDYSGHRDKAVQATVSRDGKSAWGSELATVTLLEQNSPGRDVAWRASDLLIKTPGGWRIAALAWSEPVGNAAANARGKAGALTAQKLDGEPGDKALRDAFTRLTTDGVDPTAAARGDLVAIGSGPGERTVGGAAFARAWNAGWKGKVAIISALARLAPSGTTGWVAATVELAKPGYKLPFTVFAVFDQAADASWSLVHIQLAIELR